MSQGVTAHVMRDIHVTAGGCNGSIRVRTAQEKQCFVVVTCESFSPKAEKCENRWEHAQNIWELITGSPTLFITKKERDHSPCFHIFSLSFRLFTLFFPFCSKTSFMYRSSALEGGCGSPESLSLVLPRSFRFFPFLTVSLLVIRFIHMTLLL